MEILDKLQLSHHTQAFQKNRVESTDDVLRLSVEDMKELGITKIGERNRLKHWIQTHSTKAEQTEDKHRVIFDLFDKEESGLVNFTQLFNALEGLDLQQSGSLSHAFLRAGLDDCINFDGFVKLLKHSKEDSDGCEGLTMIADQPDCFLVKLEILEQNGDSTNEGDCAHPINSEEQMHKYEAIFNVLDKDRSGLISITQLSNALEGLDLHQQSSSLSHAFLDAGLDDCINFDGFVKLLRHSKEDNGECKGLSIIVDQTDYFLIRLELDNANPTFTEEQINKYEAIFNFLDKEKSGLMSLTQLSNALDGLDFQRSGSLTHAFLKAGLDDIVNFDGFVKLLKCSKQDSEGCAGLNYVADQPDCFLVKLEHDDSDTSTNEGGHACPAFAEEQTEKHRAIFDILDEEKSGLVSFTQLSIALERLDLQQSGSLSHAFLKAGLDDCINFEEFVKLLRLTKQASDVCEGLKVIAEKSDYVLIKLKLDAFKNEGDSAFRNGDFALAVVRYSEALIFDPANWVLLSNRSCAYLSQGNALCAYQDARNCIDSNNNFMKGYSRLGAAQEGLKRFDDAMVSYKKVLLKEPFNNVAKDGLERCALETRSRYVSIFELIDKNGDGVIDFDEFTKALHDLSIDISLIEAEKIFQEADKDCSGSLDIDEFVDTMRRASTCRRDDSLAAIRGVSKKLQQTIEMLRKVPKNSKANYSDILKVDITPEAVKHVETCTMGDYKLVPPENTCHDEYCKDTYNFLVGDKNINEILARTYCEEFIWNLKTDLQQKGISGNVDDVVDTDAVISDSIGTFENIAYRYSQMSRRDVLPSEEITLQLHSFRKAAILWASNESVQERANLLQFGVNLQANDPACEENDSKVNDNRKFWKKMVKISRAAAGIAIFLFENL